MKFKILTVTSLLVILLLAGYDYFTVKKEVAYVHNDKVFSGFIGTKHLESKFKLESQKILSSDSTSGIMPLQLENLSAQYTAESWKLINQYVSDFGKKEGIVFIYGATGDGTLMYADQAYDITEEVIQYINERYEGK